MICLDTTVLIWGVQQVAAPGRERMIDLTGRFLRSLKSNEVLMVPSLVVAEYLQGFQEQSERSAQLTILSRRFFLPSFDVVAAAVAAELAQNPSVRELSQAGDRRAIKTDVQIIATAIANRADAIVTGNDREFSRIAAGRIKVLEVPVVEEQSTLDFRKDEE